MRFIKTLITALVLATQLPAIAEPATPVKLYKNPSCYCCDLYARHLEENGFKVDLINTTDMVSIKDKHGVPEKLEGCHTALIDGYVFEGLIPAQFVRQFLKEHRPVKGLALPGMPVGAPGMPGAKSKPLNVYLLSPNPSPTVYASF